MLLLFCAFHSAPSIQHTLKEACDIVVAKEIKTYKMLVWVCFFFFLLYSNFTSPPILLTQEWTLCSHGWWECIKDWNKRGPIKQSLLSLLASFSVEVCATACVTLLRHQPHHSGQIYICFIVHMMMPGKSQQERWQSFYVRVIISSMTHRGDCSLTVTHNQTSSKPRTMSQNGIFFSH